MAGRSDGEGSRGCQPARAARPAPISGVRRHEVASPPVSVPGVSDRERHVAQVNIAVPKSPVDSPLLADFIALLAPVNAIADRAPGFVWRLQTDEGDATAIRGFGDDRVIVNMSVWDSIEALWRFVYDGSHLEVMRRRREWFDRIEMHLVLWWLPAGELPTVAEAERRLDHLREHGPTPFAFTFKRRFDPDTRETTPLDRLAGCPAG
jgi:Domain of unknown function (DUF3291)